MAENEAVVEDPAEIDDFIGDIPVHGVLAPEGVPTGDGRMFAAGAVTNRELPVPLMYQFVGTHGGDTSHVATVGRVDKIWRDDDGLLWWSGVVSSMKPYSDEVIAGIADGSVRGVSLDGDNASGSKVRMKEQDGTEYDVTVFTSIRVAGLTIVSIPAYQQAYIAFGSTPEEGVQASAALKDCGCMGESFTAMQETPGRDEDLPDPEGRTGALIALLPQEDDPVHAASSEDEAHLTFIWLGDAREAAWNFDEMEQAVRQYADEATPITVPIRERGTLGDESADVLFLEPTDSLLAFREGLLANEVVRAAHDAAEQHPEWQPHVTLGYPQGVENGPATGEYAGESITFDRLALWIGAEHLEYPMGGGEPVAEEKPAMSLADMKIYDEAGQLVDFKDYSTEQRDKMAEKGEAMEDGSFPIADEEDLRNAIQSIGRAKDQDAAKRHIRKRARELGAEELLPDTWSASLSFLTGDVETFAPGTKDGPGWVTHPKPTARIRRYWVTGEGAAKIRWGVPGDFNRCRMQLAKYVQNPDWLAGLCANMHKEALGVWPGRERGAHAAVTASAAEQERAPLVALTASAAETPVYDASWFADPQLTGPTQMRVDLETGRVWGHIAAWGVCHIGIPGECMLAPRSRMNYAAFKTGYIETTEGTLRVGKLTAGVGHPDTRLRASRASAHYDKTDAVRAYVNVGEDAHGIWFAGVLAPGLTDQQINEFRAIGSLSGDWRLVGGNLELIAAVNVNTPGFPIPEPAFSGEDQVSLVAAGVILPDAEVSSEQNDEDRAARIERIALSIRNHHIAALSASLEKE